MEISWSGNKDLVTSLCSYSISICRMTKRSRDKGMMQVCHLNKHLKATRSCKWYSQASSAQIAPAIQILGFSILTKQLPPSYIYIYSLSKKRCTPTSPPSTAASTPQAHKDTASSTKSLGEMSHLPCLYSQDAYLFLSHNLGLIRLF